MFYMKAVGVTFGNRQRDISRLKVGQELRFVNEPDNPYDNHAVRIETLDGIQLGYISKERNTEIFNSIKNNTIRYSAKVASITGGGFNTAYGLNIEVNTESVSR